MQIINLSKSQRHLIITISEYDEFGLPTEEKRAAVAIDPTKDPKAVLEAARKFEWEITGDPVNGFYPNCTRTGALIEEESAEELETK